MLLLPSLFLPLVLCASIEKPDQRAITTYDQSQVGDMNVQLHLKDFKIIALFGDEPLSLGDYEYNYDYGDLTVKPVVSITTSKPQITTKPSLPPSTTVQEVLIQETSYTTKKPVLESPKPQPEDLLQTVLNPELPFKPSGINLEDPPMSNSSFSKPDSINPSSRPPSAENLTTKMTTKPFYLAPTPQPIQIELSPENVKPSVIALTYKPVSAAVPKPTAASTTPKPIISSTPTPISMPPKMNISIQVQNQSSQKPFGNTSPKPIPVFIKPSSSKPSYNSDTAILKPYNTSVTPANPPTVKITAKPPKMQSSTPKTTVSTLSLLDKPSIALQPVRKPIYQPSNYVSRPVQVSSTINSLAVDSDEKRPPVGSAGIVPPEEVGGQYHGVDSLSEIVHYKKCNPGYTRDQHGHCRKTRRPNQPIPYGIGRIALHFLNRLKQLGSDPELMTP